MKEDDKANKIFYPKLLTDLKTYNVKRFSKDLISGLIVAIIALPLSIALALCSGVGPQEGLYTAIIAGFTASFLGGCSVQISGPTAAFATTVATIVAKGGMGALCSATILAGIFIILFAILKLGNYIKHMPYPIVVGFTGGIAITIVIGQLKDFFGVQFLNGEKPIESIEKISKFIEYFDTNSLYALAVGILSLLVIIFWNKVPKVGSKIPSSLIAVILASVAVYYFRLDVKTIGDLYTINSGLPNLTLPSIPSDIKQALYTIKDAAIIAILASIGSLLSARVADEMTDGTTYPNTELIGQGFANIASALFGGIPATGAIARTAANIKNGGSTAISGMFHALILLLVLLFLIPLASLIPMPTIAAILFFVAYNMSGWRNFKSLITRKDSIKQRIVNISELFVTFVFTICFDLVVAIIAGIILHIVFSFLKFHDKEKSST